MSFKEVTKKVVRLLGISGCVLSIILFVGCSSAEKQEIYENEKLNVVATTTMLYDLSSIIGGENVEAYGLMGVGIDPHLYKASAGDVQKMQNADVVIYNGIHLEGQMGEIFDSLDKQNKDVVCIEEGLDEDVVIFNPMSPDSKDPHIWFDVKIWMEAAKYVAESFAEIDSDNADKYKANLEKYLTELEDLHNYILNRSAELPIEKHIIITAHDAFNYFGKAYNFEVIGLQGISTETEVGTADVSDLAKYIADNKIKAIFVESSVSTKNIEALQDAVNALGFDVEIGGELYSDSLGDASNGHDTYIATVKSNVDTIVNALS